LLHFRKHSKEREQSFSIPSKAIGFLKRPCIFSVSSDGWARIGISFKLMFEVKVKWSRYTPWWALGGERRYSSYVFLTSALERVSGWCHALAALNPWYPFNRRKSGTQSRSAKAIC
jgi:hypothetical protein